MGYIDSGIGGFKDLFTYLTAKSKTRDIHKNAVLREIRDNIKLLEHRDKTGVNIQALIEGLSATAIEQAYTANFNFKNLADHHKSITAEMILNKRQEKYIGWNCKKIIYSIEGKIKDIKNIPKLYSDLSQAPVNLPVRLDNLFFQMVLLVVLIRSSEKA